MKHNQLGNVIEIFSATKDTKSKIRPIVSYLELIENIGIKDDKFALKNLDRTVMIVGLVAYETAKQNNIELQYGSLGENILLDFNPHILNIGDIIRIDDTILEVTEKCTICKHLSIYDEKLPLLVAPFRGLYCKIINGGNIIKDMEVYSDKV